MKKIKFLLFALLSTQIHNSFSAEIRLVEPIQISKKRNQYVKILKAVIFLAPAAKIFFGLINRNLLLEKAIKELADKYFVLTIQHTLLEKYG